MKKITLTLIALIATVAMMAQGMAFEPEGTTLEQAAAKAKAENKLIFLDCFTQWCGPCKKMARDVFPQETVGAFMNPRYINIKIDMESAYGAPLAKKLQIQAYPTFVIFNRNNLTMDGERVRARHMHFNMIFNERAAIIYKFSSRYFAGLTLAMNNSIFDDEYVVVNQNKWRVRGFFGLRL